MPGASSDSRKSGTLLGGFFVLLQPGDLQKEVNRTIYVPGSFWKEECPESDWHKTFAAKVTEVEMMHKFAGVGTKQPAVRFELTGSAADTVDSTPLWMSSKAYSQLVHSENLAIKIAAAAALEAEIYPGAEIVAEIYPGAENTCLKAAFSMGACGSMGVGDAFFTKGAKGAGALWVWVFYGCGP
jgi:hypothetical protein